MQNCMDGSGVSWPKRCAYIWSSDVPTQMSEPWVCLGCACVRKTALERKWSPPISGVVKASAWRQSVLLTMVSRSWKGRSELSALSGRISKSLPVVAGA